LGERIGRIFRAFLPKVERGNNLTIEKGFGAWEGKVVNKGVWGRDVTLSPGRGKGVPTTFLTKTGEGRSKALTRYLNNKKEVSRVEEDSSRGEKGVLSIWGAKTKENSIGLKGLRKAESNRQDAHLLMQEKKKGNASIINLMRGGEGGGGI